MARKNNDVLYGIVGLGPFGAALLRSLSESGGDVLVVDNHEDKVKLALKYTDNAYTVGAFTQEVLEHAGIGDCDVVVVCIGDAIETSILTTLIVLQMGVRRVIARAVSPEHGMVLEKLGAEVVYPERDMALRTAKRLMAPQVLEYIALSEEIEIAELELTDKLSGVTVAKSNLRGNFGLNIIAVEQGGVINIQIVPDLMLQQGDKIVVVGKASDVKQFERHLLPT